MSDEPESEPQTLAEHLAYILRYQDSIFVRAEIDGKWDAYSLTDLPPLLRAEKILRFLQEGILPVRVRDSSEMSNEPLKENL